VKVYYFLGKTKQIPRGTVASIGIFDGLHKGHLHLIKALVKRAKSIKRKSLILTFYPHPSKILNRKKFTPLLISLKHRLNLLEALGVDLAIVIKFNKRFAGIKPRDFITDVLCRRLGVKEVLIGDNFNFGYHKSGNIGLLKRLSGEYGFSVRVVRLHKKDKRIVSSTHIRSLIMKGRLKEASRLLGRPVSILGTVKGGARIGRALGYPTANIDPHHEAIPPSGVYAVYVNLDDRRYKGILNIGFKPTFQRKCYPPEPTIEVHIFNFKKDIYGRDLEIFFVKRLRPEKRFKDRENLIKRIRLDEKAAAKVL